MESIEILGVKVTREKEGVILEYITKSLQKGDKKIFVTTPNPEILVYASKHQQFKQIVNSAQIAIPDGMGVLWASKILSKQLQNRVAGVDFMKSLCETFSERGLTVGFLGGLGSVAKETSECLQNLCPKLKVNYAQSEFDEKMMIQSDIDFLFVAYGFPKQEQWIYENLEKLPIKGAMGVGGAFDYLSGKVPRAPGFVRSLGFEWLFRLFVQPWRIRRQLALGEFMGMVIREYIMKCRSSNDK